LRDEASVNVKLKVSVMCGMYEEMNEKKKNWMMNTRRKAL